MLTWDITPLTEGEWAMAWATQLTVDRPGSAFIVLPALLLHYWFIHTLEGIYNQNIESIIKFSCPNIKAMSSHIINAY